jgi:hypothetical protein
MNFRIQPNPIPKAGSINTGRRSRGILAFCGTVRERRCAGLKFEVWLTRTWPKAA